MIPGEKLTETKQENFKKHQLHTPPTPGPGGKDRASAWSPADAPAHGTERWRSGPGRQAAPQLEDPPQPGIPGAAPGLAGRDGAAGDGGSCPEEGAGIGSHGLWRPLQTLSGKVVTECHDFRSAGGGRRFGGSQHEFLSFSGSSKANATCLPAAPPSAAALRVRSVRKVDIIWSKGDEV